MVPANQDPAEYLAQQRQRLLNQQAQQQQAPITPPQSTGQPASQSSKSYATLLEEASKTPGNKAYGEVLKRFIFFENARGAAIEPSLLSLCVQLNAAAAETRTAQEATPVNVSNLPRPVANQSHRRGTGLQGQAPPILSRENAFTMPKIPSQQQESVYIAADTLAVAPVPAARRVGAQFTGCGNSIPRQAATRRPIEREARALMPPPSPPANIGQRLQRQPIQTPAQIVLQLLLPATFPPSEDRPQSYIVPTRLGLGWQWLMAGREDNNGQDSKGGDEAEVERKKAAKKMSIWAWIQGIED